MKKPTAKATTTKTTKHDAPQGLVRSLLWRVYTDACYKAAAAILVIAVLIALSVRGGVCALLVFLPIATAILTGVFAKAPGKREPQLSPPARVWQWVEHWVEARFPHSRILRLLSPFASEAVSGLFHAPLAIGLAVVAGKGELWMTVAAACTLGWMLLFGGGRVVHRVLKH